MRPRLALAVATLAIATSMARPVAADDAPTPPKKLPVRRAIFSWDKPGKLLLASFSYRDVIDAEVQRKLQSGLPTVIVMRAYLHPDAAPATPVAGTVKSCRVVFDVWDEVYRLQISQPGGETPPLPIATLEGVLRRCAEARELPLAEKAGLQANTAYFLTSIVEVNPISKEMLDRIRRWVSRPPGSSTTTPGDSLFGSFVGLFVARIGQADRTLSFRTQTMTVPP